MTSIMIKAIEKYVPKPSDVVLNGIAETYMDKVEDYIHSIFRGVNKSFPNGLEYIGYEVCTPKEQFSEVTKQKKNKRYYNLARSDLYLVKYFFSFNGKLLEPKHIYLPTVGDAGIIYISGGCFHVSPVSTDKVISPSATCVFIRLLRDKINFERTIYTITIDEKRETRQVIWGRIHKKRKDAKVAPTTKCYTTALHYLLGKFGFTETFKRYLNFVPIIGTSNININNYPRDKYVICETTGIKPASCLDKIYKPSNIKLAIPKEHWNKVTESYIFSFFYIVDHFPRRLSPEHIDNKNLWKILLGHIIWSGLYSETKLNQDIDEHFSSIKDYVDIIISDKLRDLGYEVNDLYDLLALIIGKFNDWIIEAKENYGSLYNKSLEVLYYACYDITRSIFNFNFNINKKAIKEESRGKFLTETQIKNAMKTELRTGAIFGMRNQNISVNTVNDSGDHKFLKIGSSVGQQQTVVGSKRNKSSNINVSTIPKGNTSLAEVGSIYMLSKKTIDPGCRLNLFANINLETGNPIPDSRFNELRVKVNKMLLSPSDSGAIDTIHDNEEIDQIED